MQILRSLIPWHCRVMVTLRLPSSSRMTILSRAQWMVKGTWRADSRLHFAVNCTGVSTTLHASYFRLTWVAEHLGLIEPQICEGPQERADSFMLPAPHPNVVELGSREDRAVEDPLSEYTQRLWNDTAKRNRDIFTEIFRPVPTNLIRSWDAYDVSFIVKYLAVKFNS